MSARDGRKQQKDKTMAEKNEWASLCIKLLQGSVFRDEKRDSLQDKNWNALIAHQNDIRKYFDQIGVSLVLSEADGYAYLVQKTDLQKSGDETGFEDDSADSTAADADTANSGMAKEAIFEEDTDLPRLIKRLPLSLEETFLCVLLREELDKFDSAQNNSTTLIIRESEIREKLFVFFEKKTDETKIFRDFRKYINKMVELQFLKLKSDEKDIDREFEVRRIIRAKIGSDFLKKFKEKLLEQNSLFENKTEKASEEENDE